ncbi:MULTISPECIES: flagellar basal body-associated protein FliL [Sphingomonas]|uniref:Flagellar protein FliL n=1 Tax=Sphingomonas leidyi TaxID=68569 RepID=A0A7X5V1T7_9SPHN|nr:MULTISPECIES: flagellar basal body-associated FliL family protein [Sphingomonas]MBN8810008.1 flagellar basal body-associated FliL family protein [Sphingomonas sp.]NIJ65821.1 flagellar FliL protein [Sphingomonas leidyi]OJY51296.1 MAG: flagellar basal body protein FliL [Sphingomonas sp. 67-41]
MSDAKTESAAAPKKKRNLLLLVGLPVLLLGGGGGAAFYGMQAGWFSATAHAEENDEPRLVPKSEEKRASAKEGGEGGHGGEGGEAPGHGGKPTPKGEGGDKYASSYYPMEKEFTSNLQDSVHFVQVGIAVSTPYDERVLENIKTHEIAIRSAVLMALGETTEDEVFTAEGKRHIQDRLAKAINGVLKEKEGFGGVSNVYFTNFIVQ